MWYKEFGVGLCFSMLASNFSTKASESSIMFFNWFRRWKDRGYTNQLTNGIKGVNSKQLLQQNLNDLYTGPQIIAGEKFA